jgi:hypothetical protein
VRSPAACSLQRIEPVLAVILYVALHCLQWQQDAAERRQLQEKCTPPVAGSLFTTVLGLDCTAHWIPLGMFVEFRMALRATGVRGVFPPMPNERSTPLTAWRRRVL